MMMSRVVALLLGAFALASCCMTGQGCYAPVSTASFPFEPSGPANDADPDAPRKKVAQKPAAPKPTQQSSVQKLPLDDLPNATAAQRNAMAQDGGQPTQEGGKWEDQQAADREADARLSSQLKICRGC
ncbi:hypothetical protein [Bradyrhizobium sp. dw_411]|uniref:hypothetical protein n=1 Tax=Bradyrhizobium sp. dw_411 TaxID=2720082 RepID=UPI001BCC7B67|nr:hypothetical protein [Bradyrhizobium sp. dw_411]